jgi:hypothetical protein
MARVEVLSVVFHAIPRQAVVRSLVPGKLRQNPTTRICNAYKTSFIRAVGNFPRRTSVRDLCIRLKLPYLYDCVINFSGCKHMSHKILKTRMFLAQG